MRSPVTRRFVDQLLRWGVPVALWVYFLLRLLESDAAHPHDPVREELQHHGHDDSDALPRFARLMAIEVAVGLLFMHPWARRRRPLLTGLGLVVAVPWLVILVITLMHSGSLTSVHLVWVFWLTVLLLATALVDCFVVTLRQRRLPALPIATATYEPAPAAATPSAAGADAGAGPGPPVGQESTERSTPS